MGTALPATIRTPIILRNSPIVLVPRRLGACLGWVFGLCFELIAVNSVAHRSFVDGLLWAASGVLSVTAGTALWSATRKMARNTARLTSEGAYFHFDSKGDQRDIFLAWPDITKITAKRSRKVLVCSVFATGDRVVQFSSLNFVRPKHVARVIAEHAGQTVT